jgi:hypothetical protein
MIFMMTILTKKKKCMDTIPTNQDSPPDQEEKKSKPKRPDVAARLLHKREYEEKVVSCSLPKRLGHALNDDCRHLLSKEIDRWVLSTSEVVHRLSLMFNRLLLCLMNRDLPLPPFT